MQPRVLLNMAQLLEPSIAIGTFVRFFPCVDSYMLHQLMIAAERFQTLLTLVRFDLRTPGKLPAHVHLHRRLVHEYLKGNRKFGEKVDLEKRVCVREVLVLSVSSDK